MGQKTSQEPGAEQATPGTPERAGRERPAGHRPSWRRRLKRAGLAVLVLLLVVGVLVVLAGPWALGRLAPAVAARLPIPGKVQVEGLRASWLGGLSVDRLSLFDPDGRPVASLSARTGGGLLGLLDGRLDEDLHLAGWAAVRMAENGTTNIHEALGLPASPSAEPDAPRPEAAQPIELPFRRVVLDGLDLAFTRPEAPTIAIAGLAGQVQATQGRLRVDVQGRYALPSGHPSQVEQVRQAPVHGTLQAEADVDPADLSGTVRAAVQGLTEAGADALGRHLPDALGRDALAAAAKGTLSLRLDAALESARPVMVALRAQSQTLDAQLSVHRQGSDLTLADASWLRLDAQAFLDAPAVRSLLLPAQSVAVRQAGDLRIRIDAFRLPWAGGVPNAEALASATLQASMRTGLAWLEVPDDQGRPVAVRINEIVATVGKQPGEPARLEAFARAGVRGQPDGTITIQATARPSALLAPEHAGQAMGLDRLGVLAPQVRLEVRDLPVMTASPWLGAVQHAGLRLPEVVGPKIQAAVGWSAAQGRAADLDLTLRAEALQLQAQARLDERAITLRGPARLVMARPGSLLKPWLPEGWALDNGQGLTLDVDRLELPLQGSAVALDRAVLSAQATADGLRLHRPQGASIGLDELVLGLTGRPEAIQARLDARPAVAESAGSLHAQLETAPLAAWLDAGASGSVGWPAVLGTVRLEAPAAMARALDVALADRPLDQWLADVAGPQLVASIELTDPGQKTSADGAPSALAAGSLTVQASQLAGRVQGLRLWPDRLGVQQVQAELTPSDPLWAWLADRAGLHGSTLSQAAPIALEVGSFSLPVGGPDGQGPGGGVLDALARTPATLSMRGVLEVQGLPVPAAEPDHAPHQLPAAASEAAPASEPERIAVRLAELNAHVDGLGRAIRLDPLAQARAWAVLTRADGQAIGTLRAELAGSADGPVRTQATVELRDAQLAARLAGLDAPASQAIEGALGSRFQVHAVALADAADAGQPWTDRLEQVELEVDGPRLSTQAPIVVRLEPETMQLAQPVRLVWSPQEAWLAQALGARVSLAEPVTVVLDRVELGNPLAGRLGLLDPDTLWLDVGVRGGAATIAVDNRPDVVLESLDARVRRTAANTYALTARAGTAGGGRLEINGLIDRPVDDQGRLGLEQAVLRGTIKGDDVPVAVADALSNTDGLLADSLGPVVDLDAEVSDGRLAPGRPPSANLRFSVRGPRADASGYGRLEDHVIAMPQPQTVLTVREVRPEVAQRFSELVPELLLVEKRPEDGPAVIQTEGLRIPTNGDWSKGFGKATIALGTARFRTSSLLSQVLKATGQRPQGQVGRRIEPIRVSMERGVITYQPFTLPLGDLTIESEGTVDLVNQRMDVLVWLPMTALTDEAAGRFNTGLGGLVGRTIPLLGTATTVPWRVIGPLSDPTIRPAPQVLIERRGEQLLGPLLSPGQTLQDLLSIPRRREPSEPPASGDR